MDSSEQLVNCKYLHYNIKYHWKEIIQENVEIQKKNI